MLGLTQLLPVQQPHQPRLWLIFFGEAAGRPWWSRLLRPGFRHVRAAAWFDQTSRWVFIDPTLRGIQIEIETDEAFAGRWGQLWRDSTVILRMQSQGGRGRLPPVLWCVGAIKALLGVRSCALAPHGLFRDLMAQGAEIVARPKEADIGRTVFQSEHSVDSAGGPGRESGAGRGGRARTGRPHQGDAEPATPRNATA
jgi:hypothetical protein